MSESTIASVILGSFGLIITFVYNHDNRKLSNDKMNKELFMEFNNRYSKLNNSLFKIIAECDTIDDIRKDSCLSNDLNDYFNLCAEEYYWYKKGRIDSLIWKAWLDGMNDWYKYHMIQDAWAKEIEKFGCISYYIKDKNEFFLKREKV